MLDALMRDLFRINTGTNAWFVYTDKSDFRTVSLWVHFLTKHSGSNLAMNYNIIIIIIHVDSTMNMI